MAYLVFELTGDMAMWRNPYESMGSFSCLGPAPSNIAGLLGAAMGFASPRSQAGMMDNEKHLATLAKKGLPWPVSPELLHWMEKNDYHVACRWTGGFPKRVPWNVNGWKEVKLDKNLRLQQQVIEKPSYEVSVRLPAFAAKKAADALKSPAFPLCLGASFCRAIVKNVDMADDLPERKDWAYHKKDFAFGETTPFSLHVVNSETTCERISSFGYWVYPTPSFPGELQSDPMMKGYCRLDEK